MKKTIIIDLDNTVINTKQTLNNLIDEMVEEVLSVFKSSYSKKELVEIATNKFQELSSKIGQYDFNLYLTLDYIKGFMLGNNPDYRSSANEISALTNLAWSLNDYFIEGTNFSDGGKELLIDILSNKNEYNVILYSNGHGDFQEMKINNLLMSLEEDVYFDDIYVTPRKDKQTMYSLIKTCKEIDENGEIIVISNDVYGDIIPAKELGLKAIYVQEDNPTIGIETYIKRHDFYFTENVSEVKSVLLSERKVA
ncbi:MAG: hypothetical protein ACOCUI_01475 [bacterium]